MPLFEEKTDVTKDEADRLVNIIKTKGKLTSVFRLTRWAAEFARLRRQGKTTEQITDALDWLDNHYGDAYTPVIKSASSFCTKFVQIEAAMSRTAVTDVVVTADTHKLITDLGLRWPAVAKLEEYPIAVQLSRDNYAKYRRRIAVAERQEHDPHRRMDLRNILEGMPSDADFFVAAWWINIHSSMERRTMWNGGFLMFAVSLTNYLFCNAVSVCHERYAGWQSKRIDEILEIMGDVSYDR